MQGEDHRDEVLRQAAELRAWSARARADAVRIVARSRQLMTQSDWTPRAGIPAGAGPHCPDTQPESPIARRSPATW